jgi:hypothetical protein
LEENVVDPQVDVGSHGESVDMACEIRKVYSGGCGEGEEVLEEEERFIDVVGYVFVWD